MIAHAMIRAVLLSADRDPGPPPEKMAMMMIWKEKKTKEKAAAAGDIINCLYMEEKRNGSDPKKDFFF